MRTGLIISASAHVIALGFALIDGLVSAQPAADQELVLDGVQMISEAQFEALISSEPAFIPAGLVALGAPEQLEQGAQTSLAETSVEVNDVDGPDDPSERDGDPNLSAVLNVLQVESTQETSELASVVPRAPVLGLARPTAPSAQAPRPQGAAPTLGRSAPARPSLNIDTRPSAPPPEETRTAETDQSEIADTSEATEETPEDDAREETARQEAATDIIPQIAESDAPPTEAIDASDPDAEREAVAETSRTDIAELIDPDKQISGAPLSARAPLARPSNEQPVTDSTDIARASEVESLPRPAPPQDPNLDSNGYPIGAPISGSERDGLIRAIGNHWNISVLEGLPDADNLVVVVGVTLNVDGSIVNNEVRPIEPANPQGPYLRAFQAAQRAILQAGFRGEINMPADKYARWREVEITFAPGTKQIGF